MPVVDSQSYAQFMQVMQGYTGQVLQFAEASRRLALAEKEYDARLQLERDHFQLQLQTAQATQALRDVQLQHAQFELQTAKTQQAKQTAAETELGELYRGPLASLLEAARGQDEQQTIQAQATLNQAVGRLSPLAQQMYYQRTKLATEARFLGPEMESKIQLNLAQAAAFMGRTGTTELGAQAAAEQFDKAYDFVVKGVNGFTRAERTKRFNDDVEVLNKRQEAVKALIREFYQRKNTSVNTSVLSALAGNLGNASVANQLNSAFAKTTTELQGANEQAEIAGLRQALNTWQTQNQTLTQTYAEDMAADDVATNFLREELPRLRTLSLTKAGSALAMNTLADQLSTRMRIYTPLLNQLKASTNYRTFLQAKDAKVQADALKALDAEITEALARTSRDDADPIRVALLNALFKTRLDQEATTTLPTTPSNAAGL